MPAGQWFPSWPTEGCRHAVDGLQRQLSIPPGTPFLPGAERHRGAVTSLGQPRPPLVCWLLPQALWQKEQHKHLQQHFACKAACPEQEMSVWVKELSPCCKQFLWIVSWQITPEFTFSLHTCELDFHLSVRRHTINITDRLWCSQARLQQRGWISLPYFTVIPGTHSHVLITYIRNLRSVQNLSASLLLASLIEHRLLANIL